MIRNFHSQIRIHAEKNTSICFVWYNNSEPSASKRGISINKNQFYSDLRQT